VSTRKLIAIALVCGLAILLAGGVQLVLLSGHKDSTVALLTEGQTAKVGAVDATLVAHEVAGDEVRISVKMTGASADANGWALLTRTGRLVPRLSAGAGCLGGGTCEVVFDAKGIDPVGLIAIYGQGTERRSWQLKEAT
jgi:hypothetical protein